MPCAIKGDQIVVRLQSFGYALLFQSQNILCRSAFFYLDRLDLNPFDAGIFSETFKIMGLSFFEKGGSCAVDQYESDLEHGTFLELIFQVFFVSSR